MPGGADSRHGAPSSPYFPLLDSLRGIAALGVFVLHVAFYVGIGVGTGVAQYLVEHVSNYPAPSVVIFFGLSGFVLYRPFALRRLVGAPRGTFTEYTIRRAARILPAYWASLLVTAIVLHRGYVFSTTGLARYFAFTQVYDGRTFTLGSPVAWSLDVDVAFYAVLPLIVLLVRRLPAGSRSQFVRTELALCAALYALSTVWQGLTANVFLHRPRWFFPAELSLPGSLDIFVCGMALAVLSVAYADRNEGRFRRIVASAPWLLWGLAVAAYVGTGQIPSGFAGAHTVLAWLVRKQLRLVIALGALTPLVFGVHGGGWIREMLASRPARFLGSISYAFYLWHWAVIEYLVAHRAPQRLGNTGFIAASLFLTVALASASWYGLERPVSRVARGWLKRRVQLREPASVLDSPGP